MRYLCRCYKKIRGSIMKNIKDEATKKAYDNNKIFVLILPALVIAAYTTYFITRYEDFPLIMCIFIYPILSMFNFIVMIFSMHVGKLIDEWLLREELNKLEKDGFKLEIICQYGFDIANDGGSVIEEGLWLCKEDVPLVCFNGVSKKRIAKVILLLSVIFLILIVISNTIPLS